MKKKESWNSQVGVILAVAGSAIGLGNFLRFPGNVAQNGGAAFMIAYVISFLLLGLPMCWAEWGIGRLGGTKNFNSSPGILGRLMPRTGKYLGITGIMIPFFISMYYLYIETWCLGYAVNFAFGNMDFKSIGEAGSFWQTFIGYSGDGSAFVFDIKYAGFFFIAVILLNFYLIFRGLNKGIEAFCNYAMPTLLIIGIIILIRVLTLGTPDPSKPENNISNGLGFLWNPEKTFLEQKQENPDGSITWTKQEELVGEASVAQKQTMIAGNDQLRIRQYGIIEMLMSGKLWLAATGQMFFSLSIAVGVITTYASYLKRNDDVVLSGLSACSANEFCEVVLGGLITIPAAVAFCGIAGVSATLSTFGLGFNALPMVFSKMQFGALFGFLFFFLLFLAAVTSSLSMLQPCIAFLEESFQLARKKAVTVLSMLIIPGSIFVFYFSKNLKALDTLDFWAGTFLVYMNATVLIILFAWIIGVDKGLKEVLRGSNMNIPKIYRFIMKYVCPTYLIIIFFCWLLFDVLGIGGGNIVSYITDIAGSKDGPPDIVAQISVGLILAAFSACAVIVTVKKKYNFKYKLHRHRKIALHAKSLRNKD